MVQIQEVFYSFQGEGSRTGRPAIFVRTGLCNLRCPGFKVEYTAKGEKRYGCDSFYAVDPYFKDIWKTFISYKELVDYIYSFMPSYGKYNFTVPDIIFTGGEPLLYWNDDTYQRTLAHFISRGHKVTIETNAALDIEFTREYQKEIIFSQSVKLSCSREPKHKRINTETLTKIAENTKESYLKFVTSKKSWEQDKEEIKQILEDIPIYVDVWLMPMGDTIEELEKNQKFISQKAIELGFSYSHRVHISIFNNQTGV